jgi:hypothetical protein
MKIKAKHGYSLNCTWAYAELYNSSGLLLGLTEAAQCNSTLISYVKITNSTGTCKKLTTKSTVKDSAKVIKKQLSTGTYATN